MLSSNPQERIQRASSLVGHAHELSDGRLYLDSVPFNYTTIWMQLIAESVQGQDLILNCKNGLPFPGYGLE